MGKFEQLASMHYRDLTSSLELEMPRVSDLTPEEWLGIVQLIASQIGAYVDTWSPNESTTAAKVAADVLERAFQSGVVSRCEVDIRTLNLCAVFHGHDAGAIGVLDPESTIRSLIKAIPVAYTDAAEMAPVWDSLDLENIRRLRLAKNLLAPIAQWYSLTSPPNSDPQVMRWIDLLPALP